MDDGKIPKKNNDGKIPFEIIVNEQMRSVVQRFQTEICSENEYNVMLRDRHRDLRTTAAGIVEQVKSKTATVRNKVLKEASRSGNVTKEEMEKVEKAAAELLDNMILEELLLVLEEHDKQKAGGKPAGGVGGGGKTNKSGTKKGKKKK